MTTEHNEINQLLTEKDQLITALTERLEMAAEQLDRLHRTGADRVHAVGASQTGGAAVPVEMLENIQQMFGEWDEMPAATSLGRIETQISEVRDLIVKLSQEGVNVKGGVPSSSLQNPSSPASNAHGEDPLNGFELPADLMGEPSEKPVTGEVIQAASTDQAVSEWDSIKAGLLGDEAPQAGSEPPSTSASTPATPEVSKSPTPAKSQPAPDVPEAEAPAEVDLESATREELCDAVVERDDYITWLLSQVFAFKNPEFDWDNLPEVPEEVQHRLHHLETQLDAKLRMAEVSSAMERARIGRDEARIKQVEQQAQRLLKRLGVKEDEVPMQADQSASESPLVAEDNAASGKWRRLLGLGPGDE